jgi:hypothetical protein
MLESKSWNVSAIQIGDGLTDASVGSLRNVHLVITDLERKSSVPGPNPRLVADLTDLTPPFEQAASRGLELDPARGELCQLRQLLRSGWQQLGATGTGNRDV